MKLVIATGNAAKLREMREILEDMDVAAEIEIAAVTELFPDFDVEETGDTFEENALLKARAAMELSGFPAIADDSGLCVDALGGAPGVYSARYGGDENHNDAERNLYLLRKLEGEAERGAQFVSVIACVFPNGEEILARGECPGEITRQPRGEDGFGYDPLFCLTDEGDPLNAGFAGRTMAELLPAEKNKISHRARALLLFKQALTESVNKNY